MKTLGRFLFAASAFALVIAACGDHVTVPNDKTGKCTAGLLTKCGDTCVDTQTDIANCGGCGMACGGAKVCSQGKCADACPPGSSKCGDVCSNTDVDRANCGMCGKACMGNEACAKGKCVASCEAVGYLTCPGMMGPFDAGGALNCVNPDFDEKNCGACNHACMSGEVCTRGVCCTQGSVSCGGTCVDLASDAQNCGGCGHACTMPTPTCVLGSCSKCNNKVLVLADGVTSPLTDMKKAIEKSGFDVTMINDGAATYTGMPAGTDFGAIVLFRVGFVGGADMSAQGQQAIVSAQGAGVGLVLDAYDMYDAMSFGKIQSIKPFLLYGYITGYASTGPVSQVGNQFPFFAGLPSSFGTAIQNAWFYGPVQNNGVQFANVFANNATQPAGFYRAAPNGRIVHFGFGINWSGGAQGMWTQDPVQTNWFMNGVRWAAGCAN